MDTPDKKLNAPKWPFVLAQVLLLGFAYYFVAHSPHPISFGEVVICFVAAFLGAVLGIMPFMLDYKLIQKKIEGQALGEVTAKIQNLERVAAQVSSATNEWVNVQTQAEKTSNGAREIAARMTEEVRQFSEFMQQMNDGEKAALRLETEKLRRAEGDWLQVLVRILDHVFLLHSAAARSGQPKLAEQITGFQNACRDAARRIGLAPFIAEPGEPFNTERHQTVGNTAPVPDAVVSETVGTGYTFQGKLLRPALVRLNDASSAQEPVSEAPAGPSPSNEGNDEGELPLQSPV